MLNSLKLFLKDVNALKYLESIEINDALFNQPKGVKFDNTINTLNDLFKKSEKEILTSLKNDVQSSYFPIHVSISFEVPLGNNAKCELESIIIQDRHNYSYPFLQLMFRQFIRKSNSPNYFYSMNLQIKIGEYLDTCNYELFGNPYVTQYDKTYETFEDFDKEMSNLMKLYRDNLENIDLEALTDL